MTIAEYQKRVDDWIKEYGVRYFDPLSNMVQLTEEVGEVARIIARKYGEQSPKPGEDLSEVKLADELADILWVITCIANQTGINLTSAVQDNIAKKTLRDQTRHKCNPKLTSQQV